ncbi:hypothetical protein [Methylobacterium brachiatum]
MLEYVRRAIVATLVAVALILAPFSGFAPTPAHAGLLTRALAAGTTFVSANLIRVMFLHASMHAREAAKRKFFEVLVRSPELVPKATRMVESFLKSPKIQQKLAGPDGTRFLADEVGPVIGRLKAWSKPQVADARMKNIVGDLFRPGAKVGNGSTADAVRHELRTGELVGGRGHLIKAQEALTRLRNHMSDPTATPADKGTAKVLAQDLLNALRGR